MVTSLRLTGGQTMRKLLIAVGVVAAVMARNMLLGYSQSCLSVTLRLWVKAYLLGTFLTREVTVMGFKVASRVRGLSDEAFREGFGAEEHCRSALSRLR